MKKNQFHTKKKRSKKRNTLARENSSSVTIVLEPVVEEAARLESAALVKSTSLTLWCCLGLNFDGDEECTERKQRPLCLLVQNLPNCTS